MRARRIVLCAFVASVAVLALFSPSGARPTAARDGRPAPLDPVKPVPTAQAQASKVEALAPASAAANLAHAAMPTAPTADAENVELVGHIGGVTYAVFVQGDYAYIGVGPRLTILDISGPASPTVVGQTAPLPGIVQDVYISGSYAYVAADEADLRVVDVSDPTTPAEVSFCDVAGDAEGVAVAEDYAYVAAGYSGGVRVVDVSDPTAPVEAAFYDTPRIARDVAVAGGYAYVADDDAGLWVVDVSNPLLPMEVGHYDTPGDAYGVTVVGDYAYIADGSSGLRVVDVSDPADPVEVGFCDIPYASARDVAVAEGLAYVAASYQLWIVNVTDPTSPTAISYYITPGSPYCVTVAGDYVYVADYGGGLRVVDVTYPMIPKEVGFYDTLGRGWGVAAVGDHVYVADVDSGLWVVNVSNPADPVGVGHYDILGFTYDVAVGEGYVYVTSPSGLRVVDVSDPTTPAEVGSYDTPGWGYGVAVAGDYVYVADYSDGLRVVDASNPADPVEVGFYDTPGTAYGVAVVGDHAYVAADDAGLRVVDVTNPADPVEVGFYDTPGDAYGVTVVGNYAYVAAGYSGGLRVVDASNPADPVEVGFYETPGNAWDVAVGEGYTYVADGYRGLRVVDVSNPADPAEVGFYDTPDYSDAVALKGGYTYITDRSGGLFILRYSGLEPEPLAEVTISGPTTGIAHIAYAFTATVSPLTATQPITYLWQASGQSSVTHVGGLSDTVSFTWGTTGTQVITLTASNTYNSANARHTITIAEPGTGRDAYEPDDNCAQASTLATNGTAQHHTFHQHADADWARFTVISGTTYVLQANSTSASADLVLELYDACGGNLEGSDDAFGADARLTFTAPSDGTYYVKALNHDSATYGSDVTYALSVRVSPSNAVGLIVAGHDDHYRLQSNILTCTNATFLTFLRGGLARANLRYLSHIDDDAQTDADGDGVSDVDADSTSTNVQDAITNWAANLADADTPFFLYLADHGGIDAFLTDGSGDTITPDELDGWLGALEDEGVPVNVVYEACHSGSFIDGLKAISRPGRVVIASTGRLNNAYPSRRGALFSDAFFTQLGQCNDLYTSYRVATTAVGATGLWQTPWLDDNGDRLPDDRDGDLARQRGLPKCGIIDSPPVIDRVAPPANIVDGDGILRAWVRDDGGAEGPEVWAFVYPPSFEEPVPSGDGTMPDLGLPKVPFSDTNGDGEYVGLYEDFTEDGAYHVVVYAQDAAGNHALPAVTTVRTRWWAYLPQVCR